MRSPRPGEGHLFVKLRRGVADSCPATRLEDLPADQDEGLHLGRRCVNLGDDDARFEHACPESSRAVEVLSGGR